jgi:putative DNA primase/helicase
LKSFIWDGTKRLDTWLHKYMGTKLNSYTSAVGRKWLISAVARAMDPGCQADHMLIFEGTQGIGKSQALRIIGGQFYCEYSGSMSGQGTSHKDLVAVIAGKMIVEMSELATVRRAEMESLKAVLTTTTDSVRLSYERDAKDYPRTCIFGGTTNEIGQAYIADITGVRRFWPTHVGEIHRPNISLLRQDRDQLWAEAVEAYENGEDWYSVPVDEVAAEQADRQISVEQSDPWFGKVRGLLTSDDAYQNQLFASVPRYEQGQLVEGQIAVRVGLMSTFLGIGLGIDTARQSQADTARLQRILKAIGFVRMRPARGWLGGAYAYELRREAMPHMWTAIESAAKSQSLEWKNYEQKTQKSD